MTNPLYASVRLNSRHSHGTEIFVNALGRGQSHPHMDRLATLIVSSGAADLLTYATAPELRSLAAAMNSAAAAIETQDALSGFIRDGEPA